MQGEQKKTLVQVEIKIKIYIDREENNEYLEAFVLLFLTKLSPDFFSLFAEITDLSSIILSYKKPPDVKKSEVITKRSNAKLNQN